MPYHMFLFVVCQMAPKDVPTAMATGIPLPRLRLRAYTIAMVPTCVSLLWSLRVYHCYGYKANHAWPQLLVYHGQGYGHAMATGVLWLRVRA